MNTFPTIEELELVRRAARGDHEAFRCLVLFYEPRLRVFLLRLLGNQEDTYDITQETFIAAYYALPRWRLLEQEDASEKEQAMGTMISLEQKERELHPLAPWLYRIATNRALTLLKKQSRQSYPLQHPQGVGLGDRKEQDMTFEDRYVVRELLREALSCLSEDDALCLVLRFIAGEQYNEIASMLGVTKEAVRKRVARGLVALRSVYRSLDTEESR